MPAGCSSASAQLLEALAQLQGTGDVALGVKQRSLTQHSSFYDVKCEPGFQCASKVGLFGANHDGPFKPGLSGELTTRYNDAYEIGCPARGVSSGAGNCEDDGKGNSHLCWSTHRFEAGPKSPCDSDDKCMCVKTSTPTGSGKGARHVEVEKGDAMISGTYDVQPPPKCRECAQHDCNQKECDACKNCEYTSKVLAGRTTKGCFEKPEFANVLADRAKAHDGRTFIAGVTPVKKTLTVIPHYRLWDPSEGLEGDSESGDHESTSVIPGSKVPYELHSEPMSRKAWIEGYKKAAPQVQRMMDLIEHNAKNEWGPNANRMDCDGTGSGESIERKIEKIVSAQQMCKEMQSTAYSIAQGVKFDEKSNDVPVHCQIGAGGVCDALNCYTGDIDFDHAFGQLRARQRQCLKAQEVLNKEEAQRGAPPSGDNLHQSAGKLDPKQAEESHQNAKMPAHALIQSTKAEAMPSPLLLLAMAENLRSSQQRRRDRPEVLGDFLCAAA
eukprot:TRINITY_DN11499_c1_g4_i1.p1 TRINITY_DN11499_c1_g4~~TRINITY_DN11499_c1_g4_i1.p1  ORF type:complete len:497 (-),score=97.41 TRINITY_DN11499_c1_g4_i1:50-1540(-)